MARLKKKPVEDRGQRVINWIHDKCRVPEGKNVGQPFRLRQWQQDVIREIYGSPTRRAIISYGRKNGKALALDTPIPTPSGWRTIRDIEPGDQVFGADGRPAQVLATSPVFIGKPCYRVGFSDGTSLVASADHLWKTKHRFRPWANARRNGSGTGGRWVEEVVTTEQIAQSVRILRPDGVREYNHTLRVSGELQTQNVDLQIDPYLLGMWLGDGHTSSASITCGSEDLNYSLGAISAAVGSDVICRRDKTAWKIRLANGTTSRGIVAKGLRAIGVMGSKHVPLAYLWAGTEQRRALLQGLMDTDGTTTPTGTSGAMSCAFTSTNKALADAVTHLARSLGIKAALSEGIAKLNGREIGPKYIVQFTAWAEDRVFRLPRKANKLKPRPEKPTRSASIKIESCEPVDSVPTKCLMVDSPDHLFLAGPGLTPTHNTSLSSVLTLVHLVGPEMRPNSQLFSAAQSREQAAILFALAAKIVRMSPKLRDYVAVRDTAKQLYVPTLGTLYRALSAEASTAYGFSPVFVVHDELGQVKGPRSELYEALETAAGAQDAPLSIVISTQAPTDADLLSVLIDDAKTGADSKTKLFLYSAPTELDPFSDEAIQAANPALGDFLNAEEVRSQAEAARRMPSREAAYRNLVLNQRVNVSNPLISPSVWAACSGEIDEDAFRNPVWCGLDLSSRNDLTAFAAVAQDEAGVWNVKMRFYAPQVGLLDRAHRDRVPYDVWAREGWLTLTPGASVNYDFVISDLLQACADWPVQEIAFDRWRIDVLKADLMRMGAELPLTPFGQGFRDMTPAIEALETALLNGELRHGNNPILTMCAANAVATRDAAGNRKADKARATGRIDGLVALLMALGRAGMQQPTSVAVPSDYTVMTV